MCMENFFVDLWSLKELNDIKNTCNIITDNSIPKNITNNNIPNNVTNIIGFEGVFCKLQLQTGLRCSKLVIQLLSFPNLLYKCRRAHVYVNHGKCFVRMKTSVRSNVVVVEVFLVCIPAVALFLGDVLNAITIQL